MIPETAYAGFDAGINWAPPRAALPATILHARASHVPPALASGSRRNLFPSAPIQKRPGWRICFAGW
jgi:hypothetical protein